MDDREKAQTLNELGELNVAQPQPINEPTVITMPAVQSLQGKADFNLLFVAKLQPEVKWVGGDVSLAAAEHAISVANFPSQMPDDGPEHVLRRGHLVCTPTACKLTLLYAWQADTAN
jgi:hypothetical protein